MATATDAPSSSRAAAEAAAAEVAAAGRARPPAGHTDFEQRHPSLFDLICTFPCFTHGLTSVNDVMRDARQTQQVNVMQQQMKGKEGGQPHC
jgi:hypothetical protein